MRDVSYVCEMFGGKPDKWVHRHAAELGGIKVGGRLMFTDAGLEDYLKSRRLIPAAS